MWPRKILSSLTKKQITGSSSLAKFSLRITCRTILLGSHYISNILRFFKIFFAFSKVTFGGGGLSFAAAGTKLFNLLVRQRGSMIVCSDKVNQMRHIEFLKNKALIREWHIYGNVETINKKTHKKSVIIYWILILQLE